MRRNLIGSKLSLNRWPRWCRKESDQVPAAARISYESPMLSTEVPAIPGIQKRSFAGALSIERRGGMLPPGRLVSGLIPYNVVIQTIDGYGEILKPGCFAASLASDDDPRVLVNYDIGKVLGRKSAGTASFWEERDGLHFEADVPSTGFGDDLLTSMRRRDIDAAAVAFQVMSFEWGERDENRTREITRAKLIVTAVSTFSQLETAQATAEQELAAARASGFREGRVQGMEEQRSKSKKAQSARKSPPVGFTGQYSSSVGMPPDWAGSPWLKRGIYGGVK